MLAARVVGATDAPLVPSDPFVKSGARALRTLEGTRHSVSPTPHREGYALWRGGVFIAAYNGLLLAWLLVRPGSYSVFSAVDNIAQFLGPLLALLLFLHPCRARSWSAGGDGGIGDGGADRRWAPLLLGLGVLGFAVGQAIWTYYQEVIHQPPFPSWADAGYLAAYPCLSLGILLLSRRGLSPVVRARVFVDSLVIVVAAVTFSWYFVLGPTLLEPGQTLLGKVVGTAYPLWDLALILCLLLASQGRGAAPRRVVLLLALGLGSVVVTDTIFDYLNLQGTYQTGVVSDVGWPLGYMTIALAARAILVARPAATHSDGERVTADNVAGVRRPTSSWTTALPYVLVPAVLALVGYEWLHRDATNDLLEPGLFAGAVALIGLILLRQLLALTENKALYRRLSDTYGQMEARNKETEGLNDRLRESEARKSAVLETALDAIISIDHAGVVIEYDPAAEAMFGYTRAVAVGRRIADLIVPGRLREQHNRGLARYLDTGQSRVIGRRVELAAMRADGTEFPIELAITRVPGGRHPTFTAYVRDITARKQGEEALRHQALHDALTGLPNRTLLQDRLEQALTARGRDRRPLGLLLLDLDRFKEINDTFGHHYGDLLLRQVGPRIEGVLRASDTVARLGGDEFAVLLPRNDEAGAVRTARKIGEALDTPFLVEDQSLQLGGSVGIALCPDHGTDARALLRHADVAMYVAKRERSGHALYDEERDRHSVDQLALAGALRQAIACDQLLLHYQPKVELAGDCVRAVEALVRWRHPEHGLIPPDRFIPLAEQTGLIAPLTLWVLDTALRQSRRWRDVGLRLDVAVNLSMWNLHDPGLVDALTRMLSSYAVAPASVRLELTESTVMEDAERSRDVLTRLAALGVRISIDDFGTGYSSLAYLKRLPVDELKIDKSFVKGMADDENDRAIVASTINLAHSLGLRVVAEGVEDKPAWDTLARMGCDVAQGYYLSRPLPAPELEQWLRDSLWSVA